MTISDVRAGLYSRLAADSDIAALVGTRIFPIRAKQGVVDPFIVYRRITGLGDHHMEGPSGIVRPRIQVDCWSQSPDTAESLANLVRVSLDGFSGSIQWDDSSPGNAVVVQGIFFDSERDLYDDTMKLFGVSRDYLVWYETEI